MTRLLTLSLLLAACAAPFDTPAQAPPLAILLDAQGLRLLNTETTSTLLLDFGTPEADALAAIGRTTGGAPVRAVNDECGASPLGFATYRNGLQLVFSGGAFAGWWLDVTQGGTAPVLSTMDGLAIGVARADFGNLGTFVAVEESTVGTEFTAGGIYGLLNGPEPTATVTDLWAGVSCTFR